MLHSSIHSVIETQRTWLQRHRDRLWLRQMDSRLLRDIGISSSDAWQEARKPFWKA